MPPPPNVCSFPCDLRDYVFDIVDEIDSISCFFKIVSYACSDIQSYVDKDCYVEYFNSLHKSLNASLNYLDVLLSELYRLCDY